MCFFLFLFSSSLIVTWYPRREWVSFVLLVGWGGPYGIGLMWGHRPSFGLFGKGFRAILHNCTGQFSFCVCRDRYASCRLDKYQVVEGGSTSKSTHVPANFVNLDASNSSTATSTSLVEFLSPDRPGEPTLSPRNVDQVAIVLSLSLLSLLSSSLINMATLWLSCLHTVRRAISHAPQSRLRP
jgi:hypothetical protein